MSEKNISQEFRRNYFLEEIKRNALMIKRYKKLCTTLNYIEQFLSLASTITGCVFIFAFDSLIGIPIGFTISAPGLEICAITPGSKHCQSIIEKRKRNMTK